MLQLRSDEGREAFLRALEAGHRQPVRMQPGVWLRGHEKAEGSFTHPRVLPFKVQQSN